MELLLLVGLRWYLALVIGKSNIRAALFSLLDIIVGTQVSVSAGRIDWVGIGIDFSKTFGNIYG